MNLDRSPTASFAGQFVHFLSTGLNKTSSSSEEEDVVAVANTNTARKEEVGEDTVVSKKMPYYQQHESNQLMYSNTTTATATTITSNRMSTTASSCKQQRNDPCRCSIAPDDPKHITFGRKIARFLQRYPWYYQPPQEQEADANNTQGGTSTTNLDEGWCYFEHVTLPRYVLNTTNSTPNTTCRDKVRKYLCGSNKHTILNRAEPGEATQKTRLYPVWHTPMSQMGDFGIGIGLYFTTLKVLGFICLIAGLITLPNILYYSSTNYSSLGQSSLPNLLTIGSAICTDTPWVICQDCTPEQFNINRRGKPTNDDYIRFATTCPPNTTTTTGAECTVFVKMNDCLGAQKTQGIINLTAFLFVFIAIFFLNFYVRQKAIEFDEDEQTAQDYSIIISNPPHDAYDPEEWKNYFQQTFEDVQVTVCTVVVANDLLLQTLHELRDKKRNLNEMLLLHQQKQQGPINNTTTNNKDHSSSLSMQNQQHLPMDICQISADIRKNSSTVGMLLRSILRNTLGCGWDIPSLYERTLVLKHRARGLAQLQHPVSKVFVTLETEADQRTILEQLSYGKVEIWRNRRQRQRQRATTNVGSRRKLNHASVIPEEFLFRGLHALHVTEPSEPSAVRWENLDDTTESQIISVCMTTFVCLCAVVLIAYIVKLCRDRDPALCAFAIAFFNVLFPLFAKAMTNMESHTDEGYKQRSLYIKIAVFRWVNTAIVIFVITPFTTSISNSNKSLINQVCAVFIAEILTANVLQYLDIGGQIQRHFMAPRAPDQERMNMCFRGTPYDLAERYTTLTKILFLAFFYSTIFPATYFFAAIAFFVNYFVDKFSILRIWAAAPRLGTQVSEFSRKYFLNGCVIALALLSSYMLSAFPYDNLCVSEGTSTLNATYQAYEGSDLSTIPVDINAGSAVYKYCNQNFLSLHVFPPLPIFQPEYGQWMTQEQVRVTTIYGWTSVAVISFFVVVFFWRFGRALGSLFYGGYKPHGRDMNLNFSDISVIDSYVPQLKSVQYTYPLIACNIDNIDECLMSWKDPSKPYDYYNLTKDIDEIFSGTIYSAHENAFSKIAHWPPDN